MRCVSPRQLSECGQIGKLALDERPRHDFTVAGHDGAVSHLEQPAQRPGPVHRVRVFERGRAPLLDEVARKDRMHVRHYDHDVVVGVAAAEMVQLNLPPA